MPLDQTSRELGHLAGSFQEFAEYTKASHARMEAKMDEAASGRDKLFSELRTVKHDQRNTEQMIEGINYQVGKFRERIEQVDGSIADKLDHITEATDGKIARADIRIAKLEKWQNNLIGRMSALGAIGAFFGGLIGYMVIHWVIPMIDRIRP